MRVPTYVGTRTNLCGDPFPLVKGARWESRPSWLDALISLLPDRVTGVRMDGGVFPDGQAKGGMITGVAW